MSAIVNVAALKSLATNPAVLDKLMVVVAMGASATAGYFVAKRELENEYQTRLDEEIAATKKYYGTHLASQKEYGTPEEAVEALIGTEEEDPEKSIQKYHMTRIIEEEEYETASAPEGMVEVSKNIFTDAKLVELDEDDFDARSPEFPYVITFEEFYASANPSQALTYFAGDDTLADDANKHVPDVDGVIGEKNLQRFGHGSNDSRIVYIRNEKLELDFEVSLADGKYAEEVLGFKHEDKTIHRRFRDSDD